MQYLKQILTGKPQPDDNDDNVSKCGTEFEVSESFYIYIYVYIYICFFVCWILHHFACFLVFVYPLCGS